MNFEVLNKKLNVLAKAGMQDAIYVRTETINRVGKNKFLFKRKSENYTGILKGGQLSLFQ